MLFASARLCLHVARRAGGVTIFNGVILIVPGSRRANSYMAVRNSGGRSSSGQVVCTLVYPVFVVVMLSSAAFGLELMMILLLLLMFLRKGRKVSKKGRSISERSNQTL